MEKNKWCLDELKWISSAIDVKDSMFDPDFFINNGWFYLNHVKNCYYMRDYILDCIKLIKNE